MRLRHLLLTAALVVALPGGDAHAFSVSPQVEIRPPKRLPVAMPGGYKQGERIPRRHVLLRRTVEIVAGEGRRSVRFRCPGGRRVRTVAISDGSAVGLLLPRSQRNYTRRSRLRLEVYAARQLVEAGELARGHIYVLCGPR